jgi:GTPase
MASSAISKAKQLRRRIEPVNDAGYTELCVAMVGNVDVGKSSSVGVLTTKTLDDGNGSARASVFVHPHEHVTGRTSDISYQYFVDEESKRIVSFVDLCGHEMYLKTTVSGLASSYPDVAFICISDSITRMTKEHMGLCLAMGIPFIVLFTKSDIVLPNLAAALVREIKSKLRTLKRQFYEMRTIDDIHKLGANLSHIVPYITTSNKTGLGIDLVREILRVCPKKPRTLVAGFAVEHIYNVIGHGLVVSGMVGTNVTVGDTLYMGPFQQGNFVAVKVKSIHNDYRYNLQSIDAGKRGCLCISLAKKNKQKIRKGMVLTKNVPPNVCKSFIAQVKIFHHHTTISPGYSAYVNVGMIREPIKFVRIFDAMQNELKSIRSGDDVFVEMAFIKHLNYIEPNQALVFREGEMRGAGTVISINGTPTIIGKDVKATLTVPRIG